jgi:hypothetical protein
MSRIVEIIQGPRLRNILDEIISPQAADLGLQWRGDYTWLAPGGPIRRYLQFCLLKGASASLLWGVSLAFMPHFQGKKLGWHRTFRNAKVDLFEISTDYLPVSTERGKALADLLYGEAEARRTIAALLKQERAKIRRWFERAGTEQGLLEIAVEQMQKPPVLLHWPSPVYVLAFLQARQGLTAEAHEHLAHFLNEQKGLITQEQEELLLAALARAGS